MYFIKIYGMIDKEPHLKTTFNQTHERTHTMLQFHPQHDVQGIEEYAFFVHVSEAALDANVQLPEHAVRPLDTAHVMHIALNNIASLPPVDVVEFESLDMPGSTPDSVGVIITDGYHRQEAYRVWTILQYFYDAGDKEAFDVKSYADVEKRVKALPETQQNELNALIDAIKIPVVYKNYDVWHEVIKACLLANTTHGKADKGEFVSWKAAEYYLLVSQEVNPPTLTSVAIQFGIAKSTLSEYVKKLEKKNAPASSPETVDGEADTATDTPDTTEEEDKARGKAVKAIATLRKLYETSPESFDGILLHLLPEIAAYAVTHATTIHDELTALNSTSQEQAYLMHFGEELVSVYTPAPKKAAPKKAAPKKAKQDTPKQDTTPAPEVH